MRCPRKVNFVQKCKNEALPIGVCRDHANPCKKPGCNGLAAYRLCPKHECATEGCIQQRAGHGDSCSKHGCKHTIQPDGVSVPCGNARVKKADFCSEHLCAEPGCRALHCIGPYCHMHGCNQRLENGFCGDVTKQDSYLCKEHACAREECGMIRGSGGEYCTKHMCATNGCMEQCVENFKHCEAHECAYDTCHQERGVGKFCNRHGCIAPEDGGHCGVQCRLGSPYCEGHACAKKSCLDARDGRGDCCGKHGCVHREGRVVCCVIREEGSDYCARHACAVAGCGDPRDGKACCKRHGCQHTEPGRKEKCGIQKEAGTDYCKDHACTIPRCGGHSEVGRMCGKHGCAFKVGEDVSVACGAPRKEGRKWCASHACMLEACMDHNDGVGRCCTEHGCTREVNGDRCGEPKVPGRELCDRHAYPQKYESLVADSEETSARVEPPPTKTARGTSRDATRLRLEQRLTDSGLDCAVFGGNDSTWDDVVGLDDVKETIKRAVVYPLEEPDLPEGTWANGILLFGPPGTGKTLVAKAAASEINGFVVNVNAASVISKWAGESEKNIENLFRIVTKHADETGKPVVLFMDEVEALVGSYEWETAHNAKAKGAFQTNMSNLKADKRKVYVIAATNKPNRLGSYFIRRFQKRVYVKLPSKTDREGLFRFHTKYEVEDDVDFEALAWLSVGYSPSDIKDVCDTAINAVFAEARASAGGNRPGRRRKPVSMKDLRDACLRTKPAVTKDEMPIYEKMEEKYGSW